MTDEIQTPIPLPITNVTFVKYDATGRILFQGSVPSDMLDLQRQSPDDLIIEGTANLASDYVVDGVITPRPASPATLNGMTLFNMPIPAKLRINEKSYDSDADTIDLAFTYPGTYNITVLCWPFLDANFQVVQS